MSERTETNIESNSEVGKKPVRRRSDAAYKLQISDQADRCTNAGELGGPRCVEKNFTRCICPTSVICLRKIRFSRRNTIAGVIHKDAMAIELEGLKCENQRLGEWFQQAETIIEVPTKPLRCCEFRFRTVTAKRSVGANDQATCTRGRRTASLPCVGSTEGCVLSTACGTESIVCSQLDQFPLELIARGTDGQRIRGNP